MMNTHALTLFARVDVGGRQCDACLLVYVDPILQDSLISADVRQIYATRPSTAHIYILAPFAPACDLVRALLAGTALTRSRLYMDEGGSFHVLDIRIGAPNLEVVSLSFTWDGDSARCGPPNGVDPSLIRGWLFDLFDRGNGVVNAPLGVHFRKGSGKHANQFLRTANILLSSHACAVVAFFALVKYDAKQPRVILVDTAPLISIAQAMVYMANCRNLWKDYVSIKSFSSYGGVDEIPRIAQRDWFLISASTSGSLADELVHRGANRKNITIIYYLGSNSADTVPPGVVCDLTYSKKGDCGYERIANFKAEDCPLCAQGFLLAELEGDQFLFQRRRTRRVRVKTSSQHKSTRKLLEEITRKGIFQVNFRPTPPELPLLRVDVPKLLLDQQSRVSLIRQLKRFVPTPLRYVVLSDVSESIAQALFKEAQIPIPEEHVRFVDWSQLDMIPVVDGGGVLVLFGVLVDHARARQINATLRGVAPRGNVAYISTLTVAETPEQYADLSMFLTYGEHGRDTFIFRSVLDLALPINLQGKSAWELEYDLLSGVCMEPSAPKQLVRRKQILEDNACSDSELFMTREGEVLQINNDFVYLNTANGVLAISQADILVVVANALSCARSHDRAIGSIPSSGVEPQMRSSLYGHVLLCPQNFRLYNDSILRAAFLRLALPSEMAYANDEACSEEMLEIIEGEISAWARGAGGALPEFILALASGRLRLDDRHMAKLQSTFKKIVLPSYLGALIGQIPPAAP